MTPALKVYHWDNSVVGKYTIAFNLPTSDRLIDLGELSGEGQFIIFPSVFPQAAHPCRGYVGFQPSFQDLLELATLAHRGASGELCATPQNHEKLKKWLKWGVRRTNRILTK